MLKIKIILKLKIHFFIVRPRTFQTTLVLFWLEYFVFCIVSCIFYCARVCRVTCGQTDLCYTLLAGVFCILYGTYCILYFLLLRAANIVPASVVTRGQTDLGSSFRKPVYIFCSIHSESYCNSASRLPRQHSVIVTALIVSYHFA